MTWTVYEFHDSAQVVPDDDLKRHSLYHCECHPKFVEGNFIHNALDGREAPEKPLLS